MKKVEYKVRGVTRYIVTRFETEDLGNGNASAASTTKGEFDRADTAYEVGYALCKAEHDAAGTCLGDENFRYPEHPGYTIAEIDGKLDS